MNSVMAITKFHGRMGFKGAVHADPAAGTPHRPWPVYFVLLRKLLSSALHISAALKVLILCPCIHLAPFNITCAE
eukprot:980297-Pelagomonas_calceolata.AAC.2